MVEFCATRNDRYPYEIEFDGFSREQLNELYSYQDVPRFYSIIKSMKINPNEGIGKPERLKRNLSGWSSRRFNDNDRVVYKIIADHKIQISRCLGHYE
ncbi:type II toxin-antitoxin system YoeB family toxin [Vibrio fluvialis]|nr:type II toxin-antitoxin system YoeB family toxin [Vibrio fluvialis]